MFKNPRRGRQARNFATNAPKILDLKSSSEQIFSRKLQLGAPVIATFCHLKRKFNLCYASSLLRISHSWSPKRFFFFSSSNKIYFQKTWVKKQQRVISLADIVCVWSFPIYKVVVRNWERFQLVYSVLSASSQKFHEKVIFILRGRDRKRRIKAWAQKIFCWRGESKSLTEFIYFLI